MAKTILLPLPDVDFDVTEVAVPWHVLTEAGHQVVFATESGGQAPAADPLLLSGVIFGQLGAEKRPVELYARMTESEAFQRPISWRSMQPGDFDAA